MLKHPVKLRVFLGGIAFETPLWIPTVPGSAVLLKYLSSLN